MHLYIKKSFNIFLFSIILLIITSCGNSSSGDDTNNSIESSEVNITKTEINTIQEYSLNIENQVPTVDDYISVGVIGVDENNIEDINYLISQLDKNEIETKEQITTLVHNLSKSNSIPLANAGDDLNATEGSIIKLNASNSSDRDDAILSYNWSLNDKSLSTDVVFILYDFKKGIYPIILTIIDNKGNISTDEVIISIEESYNNPPTADAGIDINATIGDNIILDAINSNDSDGDIISYEWSENGLLLSNKISFSSNIYSIGSHNITLTVTDDKGGISIDNMILIINDEILKHENKDEYNHENEDNQTEILNQAPIIETIKDLTALLNQSILITASVSDNDGRVVSYEWKNEEEIISDTVTFHYAPQTVGINRLTLTVTDDDGAITIENITIDVIDISPNIPPKVNAGFSQNIEINNSIEIIGEAIDNDGNITSYKWEKGDVTLANTKTFTYLPVVIGTHTLVLTVIDNDGAVASDSVDIIVSEALNKNPIANAGEDIGVSSKIEIIELNGNLSSDSDGVITTYQWLKDGKEIAIGKTTELDIRDYISGIYDISLIVTDDDGQTDSDTLKLIIYDSEISKVKKTGQITSYSNGDDGDLQKGISPEYIRNHYNTTITDEIREKMWQDDEDKNAEGSFEDAQRYCEALTLEGYIDWRLPTIHDLVSILHQENSPIHIDDKFINTQLGSYWSSATVSNDINKVWFVDFDEGMTANNIKEEFLKIKCIRDN